ncbi:restriction endonuclease subunit S [Rosenbergiella epipactidis]|uniref:restriction endonuclease subunit S n=1 Tax=Rosenbergiella epipactidis TaxID=1544694 RepID=UPI001F4DC1E2|nr:restriction endonuclease subunit S [Rosenbergiella epipactidis]
MSVYGLIPKDWQESELNNIATLVTDGAHSSPKPQSQGRFMCSVKDMTYNKFDFSNVKLISEDDYQFLVHQGCSPKKGDLLISKDGANCLDLLFLYEQDDEIVLLSSIAIIRLKDTVCKEYVRYFLLSPDCQFIMRSNYVSGSAIPRVVLKDFKKVPIVLPPLSEQKAIASVLSSVDGKIDLLHRQNKTLESMAETLFRQWFVEEAQEDWERGFLPDEFTLTMGQSPQGTSFNEEKVGIPMYQGNADFGFRFPKQRIYTTKPTRYAYENDTLISVRAPVGAQNMAMEKCCIGRGVAAFKFKKNNDYYTYTYFKLRSLMSEIKQFNDQGTVFGSISKSDLENFEITLPPCEIINRFETVVGPVNEKIISNCRSIISLESLRDTLLPKLMSGEVRVKYEESQE